MKEAEREKLRCNDQSLEGNRRLTLHQRTVRAVGRIKRRTGNFDETGNITERYMKKLMLILFTSILSVTVCAVQQAENSQQVPAAPIESNLNVKNSEVNVIQPDKQITDSKIPIIKPSNFIAELRKKKDDNPNISPKELAEFGNELLKNKGYDFTFSWEPKGKENEANLSKLNFKEYYPFKYQFTDISGKRQDFQLMNRGFEHPCYSVIDVPITKISALTMTIIADGKETALKTTKDFYTEEFVLTDKSLKKTIRKWKIPIDGVPLGISEDGKKVYFDTWEFYQDQGDEYKEKPLNLAIEISEDGTLRMVDANEIPSDKGVQIDYDKKYTEIIYNKYKVGQNEYILKYSAPCT